MLTESLIAATSHHSFSSSRIPSFLKDVGICVHEIQPQTAFRQGFKKSSTGKNCLAISENHVFAAQSDKAVVNVYNREKGHQEATVPFPERITSIAYSHGTGILVLGTEGGRLVLWETASGRLTATNASHLQPVTSLCLTVDHFILSGSFDSSVHVWSLPRLVSFSQSSNSYTNEPALGPIRTFSGHRGSVTAVACGSSKSSTNFVISTSMDRTCYVWSIETCQILQTYLIPTSPACVCVDVADRAAFVGYVDGSIERLDFYNRIQDGVNDHPIQLDSKTAWPPADSNSASVQCLSLSNDGTSLFAGMVHGRIDCWDVSKGRFQKTSIDLGQPVTNLQVLPPDGFQQNAKSGYSIKNIVKPRLDLSTRSTGTCIVPTNYSLEIQVNELPTKTHEKYQDILNCPYFSKDVIDEAIYQLQTQQDRLPDSAPSDAQLLQVDRLETEKDTLTGKLEYLMNLMEESQARRMARKKAREEFGLKQRTAYFEAKKRGETGEVEFKELIDNDMQMSAKSDAEELEREVYADVG